MPNVIEIVIKTTDKSASGLSTASTNAKKASSETAKAQQTDAKATTKVVGDAEKQSATTAKAAAKEIEAAKKEEATVAKAAAKEAAEAEKAAAKEASAAAKAAAKETADAEKTAAKEAAAAQKQAATDAKTAAKAQSDSLSDLNSKVTKAAGGIVLGAAAVGVALIGESHDIELMDAKAKAVFGDQKEEVEKWGEANSRAMGMTGREVTNMAAKLGDLLKPMGFTSAQAAQMSEKMVGLSGVLSSWSAGALSAADVSDILNKAMLGQTRGLKQLGISISASEVSAKALSMGLVKATGDTHKIDEASQAASIAQTKYADAVKKNGVNSTEAESASLALEKAQDGLADATAGTVPELNAQQKAIATQQLILDKSTDAQTAWADGGKKTAERANGMKVSFDEMKESLAVALTPAIQACQAELNKFAQWAQEHTKTIEIIAAVVVGMAAAYLLVNGAIAAWTLITQIATAVQWAWNLAMSANPIGLIIIGIAALIAIIVLMIMHWDWVKNVAGIAWDFIWQKASTAIGGIAGAASWMKDWIVGRFDDLVGFITGLPGRIASAASGMWDGITSAFKAAINWIIRGWNSLHFGIPSIDTHIPGIGTIGGGSFGVPHINELATGGIGSGLTLLGEHGIELANLAAGSQVHSNPDTQRMLAGGGATQVELYFVPTGEPFIDAALKQIRGRIRTAFGGDVQAALGFGR